MDFITIVSAVSSAIATVSERIPSIVVSLSCFR